MLCVTLVQISNIFFHCCCIAAGVAFGRTAAGAGGAGGAGTGSGTGTPSGKIKHGGAATAAASLNIGNEARDRNRWVD